MLVLLPQFDEVLHPVKDLRLDDVRMALFHVVLWNRAVVLHPFLGEVILGVSLLEQGAAFVFFVPKYTGVDTMCAVGANGCIVGASMGAY